MRLLPVLATLALASTSVRAQYFSEGWQPGQPVPSASPAPSDPSSIPIASSNPNPPPPPPKTPTSFFDLTTLLTSTPLRYLLSTAGINITESLAAARANTYGWDERIPLITDGNYEELVVNEVFDSEEEKRERVWFFIVTVTANQPEGLSKYADTQFDAAYNLTQAAGNDLPHVRWGRIDYLNVTAITTKWAVWTAPTLILAQNRGRSLWFFKATQIRLDPSILRSFLLQQGWKQTPKWESSFAPGGSNEFVLTHLATVLTKIYETTIRVPKWVLMVFTGFAGTFVLQFFHRNDPKPQPGPGPKAGVVKEGVEGEVEKNVHSEKEKEKEDKPAQSSPGKKRKTKGNSNK